MPYLPAQTLACAVIHQSLHDFLHCPKYKAECLGFLTGQTEVGQFWFSVAGLPPFSSRRLFSLWFNGIRNPHSYNMGVTPPSSQVPPVSDCGGAS